MVVVGLDGPRVEKRFQKVEDYQVGRHSKEKGFDCKSENSRTDRRYLQNLGVFTLNPETAVQIADMLPIQIAGRLALPLVKGVFFIFPLFFWVEQI